MIAEREQAYGLIDPISDDKMRIIIDILQAFKKSEEFSREKAIRKIPFDFAKYIGRGKKMFKDTNAIEEYIRESRNDRVQDFP